METKNQVFKLEIKSAEVDNDGVMRIAGYANVFNVVDQANDVVMPGAFTKTLEGRDATDIKMFYNHDVFGYPVGVWTEFKVNDHGLYMEGILANTEEGRSCYELAKIGAIGGLSIGYVTKNKYMENNKSMLTELDLYEVSLTPFPCNTESKIDRVKSENLTTREMERFLVKSGLTKSVAQDLLAGRFQGAEIKSQGDAVDYSDVIAMINNNIKNLQS